MAPFVDALLPFEAHPDDPALRTLIASLQDSFCEDGTSTSARAERAAQEAAEADRRRALLTAKNVLNEMKQLMAEHQSSEAPPGRLRRAFDLFEKLLSAAEANGSRRSAAAEAAAAGEDMDPAVGWGLSSADIEEAVGFHIFSSSSSPTCGSGRVHAVEEVRGVLLPVLEARLRMQAEALSAYCHPQGGLSYGWGSVVIPRLREKAQGILESEASLERLRSQALSLVVRRLEVQLHVLDRMARLLADYKVLLQPKWDLARKDFLLAFCEAQVLKVARMQSEIRVDTYTPDTTPALARIREIVMDEKKRAESERVSLSTLLAEYQAAGSQMVQLATTYAAITKDLEDKEWALRQVLEENG